LTDDLLFLPEFLFLRLYGCDVCKVGLTLTPLSCWSFTLSYVKYCWQTSNFIVEG